MEGRAVDTTVDSSADSNVATHSGGKMAQKRQSRRGGSDGGGGAGGEGAFGAVCFSLDILAQFFWGEERVVRNSGAGVGSGVPRHLYSGGRRGKHWGNWGECNGPPMPARVAHHSPGSELKAL